ncbi:MAG: hypothetical protein R3F13_09590 [Prosthecobacter sp.]
MIKFAPPEIADAATTCSNCLSIFKVPLNKEFPHSLAPVIPLDFDAKTNNKFWQLQTVEIECPECKKKTLLKLPTTQPAGKVLLYGDDAHRCERTGSVFCFSLIGGSHPFVERISQELWALKSAFEPNQEPTKWKLHMKDLHSGDNRRRHPLFRSWNRSKIEDLVSALFELIERNSNAVFTFNVSFFRAATRSIDALKLDCYVALLADVIYGFSKKGCSPILSFDSEKEFKGIGPVVHGWARSSFQTSQRKLLYSYISNGLPVPEPQFVEPASHPCLEIADFVSFVVARGHHCQMKGIQSEYPTEKLGRVFYSWLRKDGNYGRDRLIGFPWHELYG